MAAIDMNRQTFFFGVEMRLKKIGCYGKEQPTTPNTVDERRFSLIVTEQHEIVVVVATKSYGDKGAFRVAVRPPTRSASYDDKWHVTRDGVFKNWDSLISRMQEQAQKTYVDLKKEHEQQTRIKTITKSFAGHGMATNSYQDRAKHEFSWRMYGDGRVEFTQVFPPEQIDRFWKLIEFSRSTKPEPKPKP